MKKGMVNILVLALALISVILDVVIVFTCVPAMKNTSNLVNKICDLVDLDLNGEKGEDVVPIENLEFIDIKFGKDTMNLALGKDGTPHYVSIAVSVGLNKKHKDYATKQPAVTSAMSNIASNIITIVSKHYYNEDGLKENLQREILAEIKELFDSDCIYVVTINQFVVQ